MFIPTCALKSVLFGSSATRNPSHFLAVLVLIYLAAFRLAVTPAAYAQEPNTDEDVIRVSTDLLLFPVRVKDKKGQAASGLTATDLSLKDSDQVTSGIYFTAGADRVAMMFALDQSGSLRDVISQQQETAIALFERFSERSSIAVLRFAERPSLTVPFQRDIASAKASFEFHAAPNARTAIFDAAAKAVDSFEKLPLVRAERRIVVLISDGLDNSSHVSAAQVINAANENHVSFYVIHLPLFEPRDGQLTVRPPSKGFRELAEKTGGKYFLVGGGRAALTPQKTNLAPIFQAIEEDLRSQYLLGFYIKESAKDGHRHEFSISMLPQDVQYSVGQRSYSRTQKFFINFKPGTTALPK